MAWRLASRGVRASLLFVAVSGCARQVVRATPPGPSQPPVTSTPAPSVPPMVSPPVDRPPPVTNPVAVPRSAADSGFFERPNGMLLHPSELVYQLEVARDTSHVQQGVRRVIVTETTVAGLPSWLIVESRTGTPVETRDSLFLARADLSPQRWTAMIGRSQLAVSFTRDTMYGALQSYQGRTSFTSPMPRGALLTAGMIERFIELLPLAPGYRANASLVQLEMAAPRVIPAEIFVTGEDRITWSGQAIDCWVVALRAGNVEERLWVSKDAPKVLKIEQPAGMGVLRAVLQP